MSFAERRMTQEVTQGETQGRGFPFHCHWESEKKSSNRLTEKHDQHREDKKRNVDVAGWLGFEQNHNTGFHILKVSRNSSFFTMRMLKKKYDGTSQSQRLWQKQEKRDRTLLKDRRNLNEVEGMRFTEWSTDWTVFLSRILTKQESASGVLLFPLKECDCSERCSSIFWLLWLEDWSVWLLCSTSEGILKIPPRQWLNQRKWSQEKKMCHFFYLWKKSSFLWNVVSFQVILQCPLFQNPDEGQSAKL